MLADQRLPEKTSVLGSMLELLGRFDDFTLTELAVFVAVTENEGLTVASVARLCRFTEATASRTIRRMAPPDFPGALPPSRGLMTLARGPQDNRSRHVFLTPCGRRLRDVLNALIADRARPGLAVSNSRMWVRTDPHESAEPSA